MAKARAESKEKRISIGGQDPGPPAVFPVVSKSLLGFAAVMRSGTAEFESAIRNPQCAIASGHSLLSFAEAVEEQVVVRDRFLDELDKQEHLRRIHDSMNPLLKGL